MEKANVIPTMMMALPLQGLVNEAPVFCLPCAVTPTVERMTNSEVAVNGYCYQEPYRPDLEHNGYWIKVHHDQCRGSFRS